MRQGGKEEHTLPLRSRKKRAEAMVGRCEFEERGFDYEAEEMLESSKGAKLSRVEKELDVSSIGGVATKHKDVSTAYAQVGRFR